MNENVMHYMISLGAGIGYVFVFWAYIHFIKKKDEENVLPDKIPIRWLIIVFLLGYAMCQMEFQMIFHFNAVFLAVSSYTDHYTKLLYSVNSYVVFIINFLFMMITGLEPSNVIALGIGIVFFMLCCKVRIFDIGDCEMLIAMLPLLIYMMPEYSTLFLAVIIQLFLSSIIGLLLNLKCMMNCLKSSFKDKKIPLAPAIAVSTLFIFILWNESYMEILRYILKYPVC